MLELLEERVAPLEEAVLAVLGEFVARGFVRGETGGGESGPWDDD